MKRFPLRAIPVALGLLFLASCNGSSSGSSFLGNLPGPSNPTFARMFDAQCNPTNKVFIFSPPFAAPLTTSTSFAQPCGRSMAFNPTNGMLAASSGPLGGKAIFVYNPPYSSLTTPVATITGGSTTLADPSGIAWDGSGNIWTADIQAPKAVKEFTPPFTAGAAPAATNTDAATPFGLAINTVSQQMFIGDSTNNVILVVPAPYTGVATATLPVSSSPSTIAVDELGRIFVGESSGNIDVFVPPFATGNKPAFTLIGTGSVLNVALDPAQNLYAQQASGSVIVYNGPILGSIGAPSASLGCPPGGCSIWAGLGFGP